VAVLTERLFFLGPEQATVWISYDDQKLTVTGVNWEILGGVSLTLTLSQPGKQTFSRSVTGSGSVAAPGNRFTFSPDALGARPQFNMSAGR
jgi:hypothetical protein